MIIWTRREFNLQKIEETFDGVHKNEGTDYRCSQEDLDSYACLKSDNPGPFLSAPAAVEEIVKWNHKGKRLSRRENAACRRLLHATDMIIFRGSSWKPDVIIKESLSELCFHATTRSESSNKILKKKIPVLALSMHIEMKW